MSSVKRRWCYQSVSTSSISMGAGVAHFLLAAIIFSTMVTCRSMPTNAFEYKRMLQEIIDGADTPYRVFPMAMFPDRLPAPVKTYW
ncbi:hypothetical protein RB195_016979 [Necator americanus]|uniref:Uncharacterized protein n=1 Tax=Necator americanus TaxID=51031 RepID=A0ABR1C305_NECAM